LRVRTLAEWLLYWSVVVCCPTTHAAPFAYIASGAANNVSVIDMATDSVVTTIPVGKGPVGMAVNQSSSLVYVANSLDNTISIISVATNAVIATVPVAQATFSIALNPAGTRGVISQADAKVALLDTVTNTIVGYVPLRSQPPAVLSLVAGIAVGKSGRHAYVADYTASVLRVVDIIDARVVADIPMPGHPFDVAVHPSGAFVYVTTQQTAADGARTLTVVDTTTNQVVTSAPLPANPNGLVVDPGGTYIVATTETGASILLTATNAVFTSIAAAGVPFAAGIAPDGSKAYIVNSTAATVSVIDTASLAIAATIPVGGRPGTLGQFIVACKTGERFSAGTCVADDRIIEYVNTLDFPASPGGHFFYTSERAEQAAIDAGGAGRFRRTGDAFRAGGSKSLCRFFGSIAPGPNSHFFTIDDAECAALKTAQVVPTPATVQQWNYEGLAFSETPPIVDAGALSCPASTVPVYRYYNRAFNAGTKNPWDSNHRYGSDKAGLDSFAALNNWSDEGIVFCATP